MTSTSGEFETALRRLEEIVAKLERDNVGLDESVALFKEGKSLAARCELLLKDAQASIESAVHGEAAPSETAPSSAAVSGAASASASAASRSIGRSMLFAPDVGDADPDL